ncbi:MAG: twin-arginine translocation signal domain-containing protein [Candidatus Aminicenantes bacterium]|nr:twin-arginine translocation signal domain-containing protein [Candidatus Aminicenantes bacterium]
MKRFFKRREFLKMSSAAALAGLTGNLTGDQAPEKALTIEEAARKVGKLPRRKLGYSGQEVSIIIGSGDLADAPKEAGILCGMNYWHKANQWMRTGTPESILKNREAHICQVTVDRVGGDRHTGRIDEEEHVSYVKEALKSTGLGYFDDMQLHYGYYSAEELKKERGFVRAFERLKKEGLVKHLCLSQHGYAGNSRVPGGESMAEVLTAVVDDGLHEHAQFIYSYGADPEMDRFMELARKKSFGTIAMKTARGIGRMKEDEEFMNKLPAGTSPHNALTRWLTTETMLDAVVMRVRNLDEFVDSYSGAGKELRHKDARAIEMMTVQADKTACRLCTKCQPHCPQQVPIAEILRFERYAVDDHDWSKARSLYAGLDRRGDACLQCQTCVPHCPQGLNIPDKIAAAHILLS